LTQQVPAAFEQAGGEETQVSELAFPSGFPNQDWDWREFLDLSINVNPLGPPPGVRTAIKRAIDRVIVYPERSSKALKEALAAAWGVKADQILLGKGVTEIVYFLAREWEREPVALAVPTPPEFLSAYPYAQLVGWANLKRWPQESLLVLSQPNQVTGQAIPFERLRSWLLESRNPVLIDESFLDFTDEPSAATLLDERPNLFVLRTLSAFYGIPGLRVGALIGPAGVLENLEARRAPWGVDVIAEAAALACLADADHAARSRQLICEERAWLWSRLPSIPALTVLRSQANFFLAYLAGGAAELCEWCYRRKVILRNTTGWPGIEGEAVRFAIRTRPENERLLALLREYFCG
jgi:threonine-phosphate decarboxylase